MNVYNFILNIISKLKLIDLPIFVSTCILLLIGLIFSISASPFVAIRIGLPPEYFIWNHIIYLIMGLLIILTFASMDYKFFIFCLAVLSVITLLMLLYIPLFANEIKGAKRWVYFFGISLQPSEILKVLMPLLFSIIYFYCVNNNKGNFYTYLVLLLGYMFLVFLLLLQPDLGMTILISLVFFSMLFITNISLVFVICLSLIGVILFFASYFIYPHVNNRINNFLFDDSLSYQTKRSLDAFSSGKIFGKGTGLGDFKQYLPDAHTDFIFSVIVEELGLLFGIFLILLYFYIFLRMYRFYLLNKGNFLGLAVFGLDLTLFFQVIIHICSNINLIPTKGMTLPLVSYGGSSMLSISLLIGIVLLLMRKQPVENKKL